MPKKYEWRDQDDFRLGKEYDKTIAEDLGLTPPTVSRRRNKLNISPYNPRWNAKTDALLGTMPDEALGEILGCSKGAVHARRKKLSIESYEAQYGSSVHQYHEELALAKDVKQLMDFVDNYPFSSSTEPITEKDMMNLVHKTISMRELIYNGVGIEVGFMADFITAILILSKKVNINFMDCLKFIKEQLKE